MRRDEQIARMTLRIEILEASMVTEHRRIAALERAVDDLEYTPSIKTVFNRRAESEIEAEV